MQIVINSHVKNTTALEHLLNSMKKQKEYNDYKIIVTVGGHFELKDYTIMLGDDPNVTYILCNHNSIDFTGLIALVELYFGNFDQYYMYLHDTCKVGNNFYKKLGAIDLTNVSSIKLCPHSSMNMGIYSQSTINTFRDFLMSKKNTDERKSIDFKMNANEDYLFDNDITNRVLANYDDGFYKSEPTDYYKTGTLRIIEYHANMDLYKIKANWGAENHVWTLKL